MIALPWSSVSHLPKPVIDFIISKLVKTEKTVDDGEYIWAAVISSLGKDGKPKETGVKITIVYGIPVYAKKAAVRENVKRKLYSGYKPVEAKEDVIEVAPVTNIEENVEEAETKKVSWWNRLF